MGDRYSYSYNYITSTLLRKRIRLEQVRLQGAFLNLQMPVIRCVCLQCLACVEELFLNHKP